MNGADDTPGPKETVSGPKETFGQLLAQARGKASLRGTAKRFKISHTALGRLESDDLFVIGPSKLTEIAKEMGVPLPQGHLARRDQRRSARVLAYCPNPYCPALFVSVFPGNEMHVEPRKFRVSLKRIDDEETFCDSCGSSLETKCLTCQTPFRQGAHCSRCSLSFVHLDEKSWEYLIEEHERLRRDQKTRDAREVNEIDD